MEAKMILLHRILAAAALGALTATLVHARQVIPINEDWRFTKGDPANAAAPSFDASGWQQVDVPHDWAIAGPWDESNETGRGGSYVPSGISWYRKTFTLPASAEGQRVTVRFDGVMAYSDIYINGERVGGRPNGYIPMVVDLTDHINFGGENTLAVRTDTTIQPASRWYAGAGIYRKVDLILTDPVHIEPWGVYVTTPVAQSDRAVVQVMTSVINESDEPQVIDFKTVLRGPEGMEISREQDQPTARRLAPGASITVSEYIFVEKPKLWNIDAPHLYTAETSIVTADLARQRRGLRDRGQGPNPDLPPNPDDVQQVASSEPFVARELDRVASSFGIRDAEFRADSGFWLNGRNIKLKGVCLHADGGAVGMAVPTDIWEYRLQALREAGVNAIRCAHNPPSQEFLDLADRMGFLVMDEMYDAWTAGKPGGERGLNLFFEEWWERDLRDAVRRDRNHPSVILWSAGNEIHDTPQEEKAQRILRGIVAEFHRFDPDTPVTQALFRPNVSHDYYNGLADMLDVIGTNYRDAELLEAWRNNPTRTLVGTEQGQDLGVWRWARDNPQHSGQFLWSGIDYLGEARWPNKSSTSGVIDRTGAPKLRTYQRASWWAEKPMVKVVRNGPAPAGNRGGGPGGRFRRPRIVHDWTPEDLNHAGMQHLTVYSNADEVELFLNGQSLGVQGRPASDPDDDRTWDVEFAPGTLRAVARHNGLVVAEDELKTAGVPARVELVPSKTRLADDFDSVAIVTARVVDANGVLVSNGEHLVKFEVEGPGKVVATDNGVSAIEEPFHLTERVTDEGDCIAIVRAIAGSGRFTLTATAAGLEPATANFAIVE